MSELMLEIIEGPDAGRQLALHGPIVIGRGLDVDLVLDDGEVSRRHARVTPSADGSAVVEDLGSTNGTFLNHDELYAPTRLDPGDELLIGVTLVELRTGEQLARQPSAVRMVPPALAAAERQPSYVNPAVLEAELTPAREWQAAPELDKYLDVRVRRRAQLAPLALFLLIMLALIIYFATR
jgi:pSer/pThr/pTyr-binding forkhead associated (FHA) protein